MEGWKRLLRWGALHAPAVYGLPLLIRDTGSAMFVLLAALPAFCFSAALVYGGRYGFFAAYAGMVALLFAPALWLFYNESAAVYIPVYGLIALLGNALGAWIGDRRRG